MTRTPASPDSARPRVLVIDDLFGRNTGPAPNRERQNLCGHLRLNDISADAPDPAVVDPVADAVFFRGQSPANARVGDVVENDLEGVLEIVRDGFGDGVRRDRRWSTILLDLCFYTGSVTEESNQRTLGMPQGRAEDDSPDRYFGLRILAALRRAFPALPVVIVSSKPRDEVAYDVSKLGAVGFIDRDNLRAPEKLRDAIAQHALYNDAGDLVQGHSLAWLETLREARRAAASGRNILILGERGSGRKTIARYISQAAARLRKAKRPFVRVNSSIVSEYAVASDFFGREGSGEHLGTPGVLEEGKNGDVLFEDISLMSPEFQGVLLRALHDQRVRRVAGKSERPISVRLLSVAPHTFHSERGFNEDLRERLQDGGVVEVPPLRAHVEDALELAVAFVSEARSLNPKIRLKTLGQEARDFLIQQRWSGNIQELRTVVVDAAMRFPDVDYLMPMHFRVSEGPTRGNDRASETQERPRSLGGAIEGHHDLRFSAEHPEEWAGRLTELQHAQSWVLARMLEAALMATRRVSVDHPQGEIRIHPAVKLMTGSSELTAAEAADTIKRILSPLEDELSEGVLHDALAVSLRLRPRSWKRRTGQ